VQTGFEGYLIPAPLPDAAGSEDGGFLSKLQINDVQNGVLFIAEIVGDNERKIAMVWNPNNTIHFPSPALYVTPSYIDTCVKIISK
jgi:hypothetical protein